MNTATIRSRTTFPLIAALLIAAFPLAAASVPAVVSPAWLAERLAAAPATVAVIDARPALRSYLAGHIPGAQTLMVENLRSTAGGVPATPLPSEMLGVIAHRLGLRPEIPVVVYADESDVDATYVASVLRLSGIPQVSVLDGGFKRWTAEQRPVIAERRPMPTSASPLAPDPQALISIDEVRAAVEKKSALLLDVRPPEQFAAGHLPGAKNRFWMKDVSAGSFRPEAEVEAEFEALGATKEKPVIVYCNTGHQASEGFYTLKYRLGHPNVRLYAGSWLEWSMTPGAPKEISAPPQP
jgi:thiosulfate/3-mercaptopyruvate sulfurtransferase